jgi:GNAT superfamily N-acetyltransferase
VRTLEEGIDRAWLEAQARSDPVAHAYAIWDLLYAPDRVRFVTLKDGTRPVCYLLIWYGFAPVPVVHWVGTGVGEETLLEAIPPRPLLAVVPEPLAPTLVRRRGPAAAYPLTVMVREPGRRLPGGWAHETDVRPLAAEDAPALRALARAHPETVTDAYASLDPATETVWGAFDGARLIGVARASVRLPRVWFVGGVFTVPSSRGRGFGRALTLAVTRAAHASGALAALLVRSDNRTATRLYAEVGYEDRGRRVWVDAGAHRRP